MSATVKLSEKPCVLCKSADRTLWLKLKDGTFQGVVCFKHMYALLSGSNGEAAAKAVGAMKSESS